jgi:hypothetical protein
MFPVLFADELGETADRFILPIKYFQYHSNEKCIRQK